MTMTTKSLAHRLLAASIPENAAPIGLLWSLCSEAAQELQRLRGDSVKSERRAVEFGDIVHSHVIAMRAAVVEGHLKSPAHGMQWIVNTLMGPGHFPDLDEARALGGAQALWDKETAEHEAFRADHPAPETCLATVQQRP